VYEEEQQGLYYNTRAVVIDRRRILPRQREVRKEPLPQVKGFWEKFLLPAGNRLPGVRHRRRADGCTLLRPALSRGWRALGLAGAKIVFNPSDDVRGTVQYLWAAEQPAAASPTSNIGRSNGSASRQLGDNDFYGAYFVNPRGSYRGRRHRRWR